MAATGTGKTVVAALDYRRLSTEGHRPTLLFVAHRREILQQSLRTFRAVQHDANFGEELFEGRKPTEYRHVFASIQSLSRTLEALPPKHFQIVIVDEFHHAEADTYRRLLDHVEPVELLGLTATPERSDERDILARFDGRFASELRLWDALEAGLLCPFQYFGLHDNTDISHVAWSRKGYDSEALERVYTADDARARLVIREVAEKHADIKAMRALGFCVTISHAEFMARRFNEAGIPALAVSANSTEEDRRTALHRLKARDVCVLFAVDLFNEGIDVPEIDTVLFLGRPRARRSSFSSSGGASVARTARTASPSSTSSAPQTGTSDSTRATAPSSVAPGPASRDKFARISRFCQAAARCSSTAYRGTSSSRTSREPSARHSGVSPPPSAISVEMCPSRSSSRTPKSRWIVSIETAGRGCH